MPRFRFVSLSDLLHRVHLDTPRGQAFVKASFIVLILAGLATTAILPVIRGNVLERNNRMLHKQRDALLQEKKELLQQKKRLSSEEGTLHVARRQGMVKPGEEVVMFTPESKKAPSLPPTPETPKNAPRARFLLIASGVAICLLLAVAATLYLRRRAVQAQRQLGFLTPRAALRRQRRQT